MLQGLDEGGRLVSGGASGAVGSQTSGGQWGIVLLQGLQLWLQSGPVLEQVVCYVPLCGEKRGRCTDGLVNGIY